MHFHEIKAKISEDVRKKDLNRQEPKYVLVHANEFLKISNHIDDPLFHYEHSPDGWGRYYFLNLRIIRSIDINPGEIIVC